MKICLAAIVLILCSNLAQARENLALHKPYTLDPEPNYPYCKDSDDDIHLTDGVYVDPPEGKALWVMPGTVGWGQSRDPIITIEIDLKEQCAVDEITFNTVAGSADVTFPLSVMVFLSDDGQSYGYAGDVITESVPQTSYIIHRFAVRDLDAVGRYVRLVVVRAGWYCFTDEIEVWGTRTAAAETHAQGMSLEEVDRFARERISLARQNQSSLALLRLARERLASEAGRFTAAAKTAAGALDDIEATILARTVAETVDFRRGVPYTTPDRQIGREMGRFRQAGGQLPALTAWAAAPYAPLLPFDWPGENAPVFMQTRLMAGEWGELALNLTNNTSQTQRLAVSIANLYRGDEPVSTDCISPAEVVFVDGFGFRIIADAIVPLSGELRIPAGMTRQLWLTIRTRGLAVGQYRGVIHIAARGSEPLKVPFAFHVTPVAMPEEPYLTTATFSYLHWPLALKFPQEYARDLREHYINAQVIPPQAIPYPKADAEGNFTEPLDFSGLERYIELLPDTRLWILWPGFEWDYGNMAPREGDARRTAVFSRWVRDVLDFMAEKGYGYDNVAFFWIDEPYQAQMREIVVPASRLLRQVAPQALVWMDITGDNTEASVREADDYVDIWCPVDSMADWGFWQDKRLWFYTCSSNKGQSPTGFYRYQLWQAFDRNCEGHAFWVHTDNAQNLWDDYAGPTPSYSVVYDGRDGIITSKRWEAYRAGIEDFELCRMLAEAIREAENMGASEAPAVVAAQSALDDWVARVLAQRNDPTIADRAREALLDILMQLTQQ